MAWQISKDGRVDRLVVFRAMADGTTVPIGELLFEGGGRVRQSRFRYAGSWMKRPGRVAIDPVGLPLLSSSAPTSSTPHEVPLAFYDAGPDGWGKRVIDANYPGLTIGMGEYLALGGPNRTGDLLFGPTPDGPATWCPDGFPVDIPGEAELGDLLEAAMTHDDGIPNEKQLRLLLHSSADTGGARPKARIRQGGREWIAKFPASGDRFDNPRTEAACLDIARAAGMAIPDHELLSVRGKSVLLVRRFDRGKNGIRHGYISVGTLLQQPPADYSTRLTYLDIAIKAKAIGIVGAHAEIFRRLLVNSFVRNTDDHLRNMGLIRVGAEWQLAPGFDILPHFPANHVMAAVPGLSNTPNLHAHRNDPAWAFSTYLHFGLDKQAAAQIYDQVASAAQGIVKAMDKAGIGDSDRVILRKLLGHCHNPPAIADIEPIPIARGRRKTQKESEAHV
jgi:serine/threonine-protein kinase HipA